MTARNLHRPASNVVDVDDRCAGTPARNRYSCDLLHGATVTTWCLVAGAILLFAVIAFAPRNHVTPSIALGSTQTAATPVQH